VAKTSPRSYLLSADAYLSNVRQCDRDYYREWGLPNSFRATVSKTDWAHLSPRLYSALQNFVHCGHGETFRSIAELLQIRAGETVLEVGCGTGDLAHHFVAGEFEYWGVDLDARRIALARERWPGINFIVGDALALKDIGLPHFRHAFIYGVLHHLEDDQCRRLIDYLLSVDRRMTLVVVEPFVPNRWWANPLGVLFARLDEGCFVRSLRDWRNLYGSNIDMLTTRSRWPHWPVSNVVARLRATCQPAARYPKGTGRNPGPRRSVSITA
jgi:SAM-dependent methyltransferase